MRERLKNFLSTVCEAESSEARWLQTLSLLEYMGARKIGRSVAAHYPPAEVLDHWADETRHAAVLARLAASSGGDAPEPFQREATKAYFQAIDQRLCDALASRAETGSEAWRGPYLSYLVVTSVVERRAMMVYPLYRAVTQRDDVRAQLSQLITEEQAHRTTIERLAATALAESQAGVIDDYESLEAPLFDAWLRELEAHLPARQQASGVPQRRQPVPLHGRG